MNKSIRYVLAIIFLSFTGLRASAQIYPGISPMDSTLIHFTSDTIPYFLPDTAAAPLWQIGHSHKAFFDTGSSATAIMTDTANPYRINANNWFVIKVYSGLNPIVDFWHKYQTTTGHDGGIVEFSLDHGLTWQNIKGNCNSDSSGGIVFGTRTYNFYSATDTLASGEPAFSGSSDSVVYSRFQFFLGIPLRSTASSCSFSVDTFYVRFRFVSDSVADSLAGWEIDSMKIEHNFYGGGVPMVNSQSLHVYPEPAYDGTFYFPALDNAQQYTITVYDVMGRQLLQLPYSRSLCLAQYAKGLYFYKVANGVDCYTGQLLTE